MPKLALFNIDDVEAFAGSIAARCRGELSEDDIADLRQYLFAECWLLSRRFDPDRVPRLGGVAEASPPWPPAHSAGERSTGNGAASAGRPGNSKTAPTRANGRSSSLSTETTTTISVDWSMLSPEASWTLANIAWPLSSGFSARELAHRHSRNTPWVERQLERLKEEMRAAAI